MSTTKPIEEVVSELTRQLLQLQSQIDHIEQTQEQLLVAIEHIIDCIPEADRKQVVELLTILSSKMPYDHK